MVLEHSELGDMIVIKQGRRSMQLAWTHLLPSTFGGRATMNVQNALAAAAAAFAAGASLHDIRQGLRSFSTNYYLAPGRLNEVSVERPDGDHRLRATTCPACRCSATSWTRPADTLDATSDLGHVSRIGVVSTAGDRRDADMTELGAVAARHFDVVIVREDTALRGRKRGEVADLVAAGVRQGMADGARCKQVEIVLDELASTRHAMARSNPGDLVVICVDQHAAVMAELESYGHQAQPGAHRANSEFANAVSDPDFAPVG